MPCQALSRRGGGTATLLGVFSDSPTEARMKLSLNLWEVDASPEAVRSGGGEPRSVEIPLNSPSLQPPPCEDQPAVQKERTVGEEDSAEEKLRLFRTFTFASSKRLPARSYFYSVRTAAPFSPPLIFQVDCHFLCLRLLLTVQPDGAGGRSWICKRPNTLSLAHLEGLFAAVGVSRRQGLAFVALSSGRRP